MKDDQLDSGYEYWDLQTSSVAWPVPAAGEMDCGVWGSEGNAARGQEVRARRPTLVLTLYNINPHHYARHDPSRI